MVNTILAVITAGFMVVSTPVINPIGRNQVLSNATYSLSERWSTDTFVNDVFSDNILLAIAYMGGKVKDGKNVNWDAVKSPGITKLLLKPGQTFAFHDIVSEKYKGKISSTTNAHFSFEDGFKSDGWLVGDGVCHLASFMYVAALEAGLETEAPTRHDFAAIKGVEKKYGTSIIYLPDDPYGTALQNLYITNNKNKTIAFIFNHEKDSLSVQVEEIN